MQRNNTYIEIMESLGFEAISVATRNRQHDRKVYWREINEDGGHIIVQPTGRGLFHSPDFKTKHAIITVYRGPDLRERLEHKKTVRSMEELQFFIEEHISEARQGHDHRIRRQG